MKLSKRPIFIVSLLTVCLAACSFSQPANTGKLDWFGFQAPITTWAAGNTPTDQYHMGSIQHTALEGCQVTIMTADPLFLAGYPEGWIAEYEKLEATNLNISRCKVTDNTGDIKMMNYEIFNKDNPLYRMAYFQLDGGKNPDQCATAFQDLLNTLDPADMPELPVAQG